MTPRFLQFIQFLVAVLDLVTLNVVFFTAAFSFDVTMANATAQNLYLPLFLNAGWMVASLRTAIYKTPTIFSLRLSLKFLLQAVTILSFVFALAVVLFYYLGLPRTFLLVLFLSVPLALALNRIIFFAVYEHFKYKDYLVDKVIVVGYNPVSKQLIRHFEDHSYNKEIIGICEEEDRVKELYHHPIICNLDGVYEACKKYGANEIFTTVAPEQNPAIYDLMQFADQNCIRFRIVPDVSLFVKKEVHINYINAMPVLTLRDEPLEDLVNRINKRASDIVVSVLAILLVLSWLVPLLGLLIWLDSPGPIFFRQKRSGKENKSFRCLKFRSMKVNGHADQQQATRDDNRFTRLGRFLRRSSLDEFPQFFNVLAGQMSIVGPRPHMLKHTDQYAQAVDDYMVRHFLKPGITGWAQVHGFRGEIDSIEKLRSRINHDIWYLQNWSLWLDVKIMFLTFYNTMKGDKNAF